MDSEIEKANQALSGGRWEEAAAIYGKVLESDPDNPAAHLGLGTITFHQARWDEAEKHLSRVGPETPGSDDVPGLLARIYFEKIESPDLDGATRKLNEDPADPQALYALGITYAKGSEYERALDALLKSIEADKEFGEGPPREACLKILDILGRKSEAGKQYERKLSMVLFS